MRDFFGKTIQNLIYVGCMLAVVISWGINHSILWGTLHGWLGWVYVIYYALGYGR